MPKSKRAKLYSLTKTVAKGRGRKEALLEHVQDAADLFSFGYVFSSENTRNQQMKEVRAQMTDSRFFFGKNKVLQVALGRTEEDAYRKNLHLLGEQVYGDCGLLFTNRPPAQVREHFTSFSIPDFARSGCEAPTNFVLPAGPLKDTPFPLEPLLRSLGLRTRLDKGVIVLDETMEVCSEGDILNPEQCRILKLFNQRMAVFQLHVHCVWSRADCSFELLEPRKDPPPQRHIPDEDNLEEKVKDSRRHDDEMVKEEGSVSMMMDVIGGDDKGEKEEDIYMAGVESDSEDDAGVSSRTRSKTQRKVAPRKRRSRKPRGSRADQKAESRAAAQQSSRGKTTRKSKTRQR